MHSDVLKNSGILSRYRDDRNYLLWSFIPYIAALSGEKLLDTSISFDEAATLRPDGGHNICYASVLSADVKPPKYFDSMKHWFGPCWDANDNITIWGIDSEWSDVRMKDSFHTRADRELSLLSRMKTSALSEDEYAYLAQRGYIHAGDKIEYSCIRINSDDKRELLKIGAEIKNELKAEFDNMKAPFIKAVLDSTPPQLRKMQMFVLQFIFYADGWFLLHCMKELVNSGKLLPVTEEQRRSMTMMVIDN